MRLPRDRPLRLLPILILIALAGCDPVSRELSRNYGECITGSAGERHLEVNCFNSPIAGHADGERANTARKVAEYVRDHDPKYKGAEEVTVVFLSKKETEKGDAKHAAARYVFTAAELGSPAP